MCDLHYQRMLAFQYLNEIVAFVKSQFIFFRPSSLLSIRFNVIHFSCLIYVIILLSFCVDPSATTSLPTPSYLPPPPVAIIPNVSSSTATTTASTTAGTTAASLPIPPIAHAVTPLQQFVTKTMVITNEHARANFKYVHPCVV